MTFLSPYAFWLLGALFIPIIIHILNRLKVRKVDYSSIVFIKKLESSSIYRLQLQKLFILVLRMLFIIALVLMFAKPVTKGFIPGWLASELDASLVVIIDNSASMTAIKNGKSYLDISKNEAMALLPSYKKETQVIISQTCPPRVVFRGKNNHSDIRNSIKYIQQTNAYDNLWESIGYILSYENITGVIKECVVFSDFMYAPDSALNVNIDDLDKWKFYFVKHGRVKNNISVTTVSIINRIKTLSQMMSLDTDVRNTGTSKQENIPIELSFNNQRVGQVMTEFEPNVSKSFLFQAYPTKDGILNSIISLPEDDYLLDNNWYQTIPIMNQIRCGIIGPSLEDISLVEMALKSIDPDSSFLNINRILQPKIKRLFLDDLDVVIIHNISGISEAGVKDLESFLKKGGGVIWFQGDSSATSFHSDIFSKLDFPEQRRLVNSKGGVFNTEIIYDQSYLLKDLQKRTIEKELPEIINYIEVSTSASHIVHWQLNNEDPLLIEFSKGTGNIFYFSTLLNFRWNDLPIRGMIVPLLYRLIILTGTDEINTAPVLINEPKLIDVKENILMNTWEVISPSGKTELIVPNYDRENIKIMHTDELGIYEVFSNGEHFTSFPTRLHYREYIRKIIEPNDIDHIFSEGTARWIDIDPQFNSNFSQIRHGKSLWKIFLIAALFFLLIETIVSAPKIKRMKTKAIDR